MALVAEPSGKLRICVDLSILNQNILREIHPIPVVRTGNQIDPNGIQVDPKRKRAIQAFPIPISVKELKQFLGMICPNLAEISHLLNKLLSKKDEWIWEDAQDQAFDQIKKSLTSPQGLDLYDPSLPITVSADASSFGIGAVIWQNKDELRKVIAYASRTLSEKEKRYAQIEKEPQAITWTCKKFKQYIQGLVINLETDHKPLVLIFSSKNIDDLTPRIQRLRLLMIRYSYKIIHTPEKKSIVANALSRSPRIKVGTQELEEELCAYVQQALDTLNPSAAHKSTCVIPLSSLSVNLSRFLKPFGIRTFFTNTPNLHSLLRHPITKTDSPTDPLTSTGAVYSVSCQQCPATYVGETGRTIAIRMSKHTRNITNRDPRSLIFNTLHLLAIPLTLLTQPFTTEISPTYTKD
ncbi:K02A2.6-like [Cordylochernes scorpioides]|uniref:K02A2.6-like n=1 Tax=Cordylochernes scorpioides TaxID=51811 RepID=A0ABY6LTT1_9ARAC|nr:K02A2.6-like [Cordylochernes scorpioides]